MKTKMIAVVGSAMLLMAAAPPQAQQPTRSSAWKRVVDGARRFVHDPLGRAKSDRSELAPELQPKGELAGSVFAPASAGTMRDEQVQPAASVEKIAPDAAPDEVAKFATAARPAAAVTKPARRSVFSRQRRPLRTLSEFMSEEKP